MRSPLTAALAAALLLVFTTSLAAQRVGDRRGIWLGAGLGMGSARLSCTVCRENRDGGTSGYLRAGATVSKRLLLGLEATAWYKSQGDVDQLLGSLQAVAFLYPRATSGFYLKTGIGLSNYSAKDSDDKVSSQALAGQIGVGYEVAMSRSLSIVPYANFLASTGGDVRFNDTISGISAKTSLIQIGVGLTLH
jgi:hypothetical protein